MDLTSVGLLLPSICWVAVGATVKILSMNIVHQGKSIMSKPIWQRSSVRDKLTCAVTCTSDVRCRTFSYSHSKKKCLGYEGFFKSMLKDIVDDDSVTYAVCRDVETTCLHNEECCFEGSVCFGGRCLCKPGLYFSPRQNSCVRSCAEYGKVMDHYKELAIKGHNDHGTYVNLADCQAMCVEMKNFTCLTIDWEEVNSKCIMSKSGYLDVEVSAREHHQDGWTLFQRRCK